MRNQYLTSPGPLQLAKELVTIPVLGRHLFPNWQAGRTCHSPFRQDRHKSFSVFDEDRRWKDHAESTGGDAVDFLARAKGLSLSEAAQEIITLAGSAAVKRAEPKSAPAKAIPP